MRRPSVVFPPPLPPLRRCPPALTRPVVKLFLVLRSLAKPARAADLGSSSIKPSPYEAGLTYSLAEIVSQFLRTVEGFCGRVAGKLDWINHLNLLLLSVSYRNIA